MLRARCAALCDKVNDQKKEFFILTMTNLDVRFLLLERYDPAKFVDFYDDIIYLDEHL